MDEGVKALVEFFNERGLTTHIFELCYFAANKEVAKMDLEKFKRLEECSNN